jgi:AcrR family transcriptional regulator
MADEPEGVALALARIAHERGVEGTDARRRVLDTACDLFYRHGVRAVGVDRVIEEAGVAKATFYRHYAGKDDLVRAYVERAHDVVTSWFIEEVDARGATPRARLLAVFDAAESLFAAPVYQGCALVNAVGEMGPALPDLLPLARRMKQPLHDHVVALATAAGVAAPAVLADQWMLLLDGAFVAAHHAEDPSPARTARAVAEALLDA